MLKSFDLFTGIGCITHALQGICKPLLYCEIDAPCRDVLKARIQSGDLPSAPIIKDVRKVTKERMKSIGIKEGDVDIVVGGFPCQGFSNMGKRTGLQHVQSGLYEEIIRIIDEMNPKGVFLENVPAVLGVMFEKLQADFHSRGYILAWTVVPASLLGALHERARWFCLAFRPDEFSLKVAGLVYKRYPWVSHASEPQRMITLANKADKHENNQRLGMLGNSVVPDAVRFAFFVLVSGYKTTNIESTSLKFSAWDKIISRHGIGQRSLLSFSKNAPRSGMSVYVGSPGLGYYLVLKAPGAKSIYSGLKNKENKLNLLLNPKYNSDTENTGAIDSERLVSKPTKLLRWSTPRHGNIIPSRRLTIRTVRDLPTQVRFEVQTPDKHRYGDVNSEFVEYLMGYPLNWTSSR